MAKTISELKAQSAEVKNASAIGENTATRVGQLFGDIVEHVEQYETNKDGKDASQDAEMKSLVSAEESRAKGEERGLQNQIHAEEIDRKTADTYLTNLIQQESSARETADENIRTALANETARAQAAEQELAAAQIYTAKIKDGAVTTPKIADGAVTYEKTDIIAQELGTNITKVPSQKVVTDAIQKEETERKADINGLTTALASETIQREQGDENLNAAIEAKINGLTTALASETIQREQGDENLNAAIVAEAEARDIAINNEAQARSQNDALLNQAIVEEKDRAMAAEEANATAIDAVVTKNEEQDQKLSELEETTDTRHFKDKFYIVDKDKNVLAVFDNNGLTITDVNILDSEDNKKSIIELLSEKVSKDGNKVLTDENFTSEMKSILESFSLNNEDSFYIADKQGYIFLSISKDYTGEYILNYVGKDKEDAKPLADYILYTIGDSLSISGLWQDKICEIGGCTFDNDKNTDALYLLSAGGTYTASITETGGLWRAKNLVDKGYIQNEGENTIILLQNVNDHQRALGNISDRVIEPKNFITGEYQLSQWGTSLLDRVPSSSRDFNSVLRLYSLVAGVNVSITSLPTKEGNVDLMLKWTKASDGSMYAASHYSIHVKPMGNEAATRAYILDKILEYAYVNADDSLNADNVSVDFANLLGSNYPLDVILTDTDGTGMRISSTQITNAKRFTNKLFIGDSLSDWSNIARWIDSISVYQSWKSLVSYMQKKFPKAFIAIAGLPYCDVKQRDYLKADGTFDIDTWQSSSEQVKYKNLYKCYKEVAELYNIPFLNIANDCGISIVNANKYYNTNADGYTSGNIHPKAEGYSHFGKCLANKIINTLK